MSCPAQHQGRLQNFWMLVAWTVNSLGVCMHTFEAVRLQHSCVQMLTAAAADTFLALQGCKGPHGLRNG